jgi:hypothetical protein
MSIEDKIATARKIVAETEGREGQTWAIVRGLLGEIEEELRGLRVEAAQRQTEYFTEAQFAEKLRVSEQHIRKLRKRIDIQPPPYIGSLIRYSSIHLAKANEIYGQRLKLVKPQHSGRKREQQPKSIAA